MTNSPLITTLAYGMRSRQYGTADSLSPTPTPNSSAASAGTIASSASGEPPSASACSLGKRPPSSSVI